MVTISVGVPTFNRASMLRDTIVKLINQRISDRFAYEVIIVDDGSTDNTRDIVDEMARETDIPVRYIFQEGQGYQYALNTAIYNARGEWIAFCDDDELPETDWLVELFDTAMKNNADIVGGVVKLDLDEDRLSQLGRVCRSCLGETPHIEAPMKCTSRPLPGGGNILIKKTVIEKIGAINTEMANGGCDKEFVMRALENGFSIWKTPYSIIYHRIPEYRLEPSYFQWVAARYGSNQAFRDLQIKGTSYSIASAFGRLGMAAVILLPSLLASRLRSDLRMRTDIYCKITMSNSYIRSILSQAAPAVFKQKHFFSRMNFRKERTLWDRSSGDQES